MCVCGPRARVLCREGSFHFAFVVFLRFDSRFSFTKMILNPRFLMLLDVTRSLLYLKNELGATSNVLRTGFWFIGLSIDMFLLL